MRPPIIAIVVLVALLPITEGCSRSAPEQGGRLPVFPVSSSLFGLHRAAKGAKREASPKRISQGCFAFGLRTGAWPSGPNSCE